MDKHIKEATEDFIRYITKHSPAPDLDLSKAINYMEGFVAGYERAWINNIISKQNEQNKEAA